VEEKHLVMSLKTSQPDFTAKSLQISTLSRDPTFPQSPSGAAHHFHRLLLSHQVNRRKNMKHRSLLAFCLHFQFFFSFLLSSAGKVIHFKHRHKARREGEASEGIKTNNGN
jgi:hypothetical protein